MLRFVGRHIVKFVLLMVAVSLVTFALVSLSPIDPVQANVGQAALVNMSEAKRAQLAAYWGADVPFWERFFSWAGALLHGDMGMSLRFNAPVAEVIAHQAANSLALMAIAWVISGVLGFALGVAAGARRGGVLDRVVKAYCFVLASTPAFWLGLVFLIVFSVWLGWFPFGFSVPIGVSAADVTLADAAHHLVLPALTLSVTGVANIALHTREKTIDVLESDYVRFARARGASPWRVLCRHGLRNLALPALTLQFASISEIFGGSVLVEQVFSYPGLGQAAVTAGLGGDTALLAGIALVSAAIVFGGNLAANLLYGAIDPRMRTRRTTRSGRIWDKIKGKAKIANAGQSGANAECGGDEVGERAAHERNSHAVEPTGSNSAASSIASPATGTAVGLPVSAALSAELPLTLHAPARARIANRRLTLAVFVGAVVALAVVVAAGVMLQDTAAATDFASKNLAPSFAHPFGTDWMGRDMLARTLAGLSTSVLVGLLAAGVSSVLAVIMGAVAALGGKRADAVVTWLIDLMMGIPHIVLLILISFALGKGFWGVTIGVALTHWASLARVVRAEILQCRESTFVAVARRLGQSPVRIAWRHMVPYVLPQYLVGLVLLFPHAILHEASITFLGFGLPPELPAIGIILSESMSYLSMGMWWLAVFPGLALVATVLLFDRAGQNLRKLVDPHSAQE